MWADKSEIVVPQVAVVTDHANLKKPGPALQLGDRVSINGKNGTVRFRGLTKFASGEWVGIQLDEPIGKNNGSIGDVQYFRCPPKHGVFAQPEACIPLTQESSASSEPNPAVSSSLPAAATVAASARPVSVAQPAASETIILNHVELEERSAQEESSPRRLVQLRHVEQPLTPRQAAGDADLTQSASVSQLAAKFSSMSSPNASVGSSIPVRTPNRSASLRGLPPLALGDKIVFSTFSGMLRFFGTTEFADGVWLGLELTNPLGKNDGSVNGVRYFHCEMKFGLFCRPASSTRGGISCEAILQAHTDSAS
eukprot:m.591379 g.591379  ORF g.591379 m.591379 type:complete len:310 (-) comp58014_c0_seq2:85-1014(-)